MALLTQLTSESGIFRERKANEIDNVKLTIKLTNPIRKIPIIAKNNILGSIIK